MKYLYDELDSVDLLGYLYVLEYNIKIRNHPFLGIQSLSLIHGFILIILIGQDLISVNLALWYRARKSIRQFLGDVDAAAVACGFGRTFGNKVRYYICISFLKFLA